MKTNPLYPTLLVLDDEKNVRKAIEIALGDEDLNVLSAHEPSYALKLIRHQVIDLLLLDIKLSELDGVSLYKKLRSDGYDIPTVFISGHATLGEVADAMKAGGIDFIEKPFNVEKLTLTVLRSLEYARMKAKLNHIQEFNTDDNFLGESAIFSNLKSGLAKIAKTNANVLISGESGTGKELIANQIHSNSLRSHETFIKVNCSAIPENLIESALFGHQKGAFTGADKTKKGYFEQANRGTLFLDEVADLSLSAQAKLLRALQDGEIQSVGASETKKVDVRIISASHKDLKHAISSELFREDLYYRLNVIPVYSPSLRERKDDIPLLCAAFLNKLSLKNNLKTKEIDIDVISMFKRYPWPGNIRELKNVLERMLILSDDNISIGHLPEEILEIQDEDETASQSTSLKDFRDKAERDYIVKQLTANQGNISQTSKDLNVGRSYLHRRMKQFDIKKNEYF